MIEFDDIGVFKLLWKFKFKLIFFMNVEFVLVYVIGDLVCVM